VFYVQYAHARIASIFEQAREKGAAGGQESAKLELLTEPEELGIVKRLLQFSETVEESVKELEPHRLAFYLLELAGDFHRYYNRSRVITDDRELTAARLFLLRNVQKIVGRGLNLLGVAAPLKMAARAEN